MNGRVILNPPSTSTQVQQPPTSFQPPLYPAPKPSTHLHLAFTHQHPAPSSPKPSNHLHISLPSFQPPQHGNNISYFGDVHKITKATSLRFIVRTVSKLCILSKSFIAHSYCLCHRHFHLHQANNCDEKLTTCEFAQNTLVKLNTISDWLTTLVSISYSSNCKYCPTSSNSWNYN